MKILVLPVCLFAFFFLPLSGCSGGDDSGNNNPDNGQALRMGLLQFQTRHNLQDDTCLPDNCYLTMEEETDTEAWLDDLAVISNMAVLHWDRAIPWLAFDPEPPQGVTRIDFYDGRIDNTLRNWVDAFAAHFNRMASGYVAVSILNGNRNGIQDCRIDESLSVAVAGTCPVMAPGTQISFQYDPGSGLVNATFDLERSYNNFVMYLADKLQPDYLALMVEVNLYREMAAPCPANWNGLAQLYHKIYDNVRPQVDPHTKIFATLTFQQLLDYDLDTCYGSLVFESCSGGPIPPSYPDPDPATCYPLDLTPIDDLDQGDRLEVLALSFYPDALLMDVAADNLFKLYPEDWNGVDECVRRAQAPPFIDPLAALDRFNWTKPIGIAELGARSDHTFQFVGEYLASLPGDLTSQYFWLNLSLQNAHDKGFEFYIQSFTNDYPAIGPWTVQDGILDADLYSLFNNFAYMGIYDLMGAPKNGVTDLWMGFLQ